MLHNLAQRGHNAGRQVALASRCKLDECRAWQLPQVQGGQKTSKLICKLICTVPLPHLPGVVLAPQKHAPCDDGRRHTRRCTPRLPE